MKDWEVLYVLNDWDNDDDRGIILNFSNNLYMTEEKARVEFDEWKAEIDPDSYEEGDYEQKVVRENYILVEERCRAQMLVLREKDIEE